MVNIFQERKKQQYLLIILVLIVLITFIIIWKNFLSKSQISIPEAELKIVQPREIKIDFEILKNPLLKELTPFEEISPFFEGEIGRENPFLPYNLPTSSPTPPPTK